MAANHIRLIGGFMIWVFKGFKTPLKDCINYYILSFAIGFITILALFYFGIYLYSEANP